MLRYDNLNYLSTICNVDHHQSVGVRELKLTVYSTLCGPTLCWSWTNIKMETLWILTAKYMCWAHMKWGYWRNIKREVIVP